MTGFYPFPLVFPLSVGFSTFQQLFHIYTLSPQFLHHSCALSRLPSSPTLSTVTRQHTFLLTIPLLERRASLPAPETCRRVWWQALHGIVKPARNGCMQRIPQQFPLFFSILSINIPRNREYLLRQHNILCFILDTPHWERYFHDCDSVAVESKVQASPVPYRLKCSCGRSTGLSAVAEASADLLHAALRIEGIKLA